MNNIKSILFLGIAVATMVLIAPVLFASDTACACAQSDLLMLSVSPIDATPESAFTFTVSNLEDSYSISNYGGTTRVKYAGKIYARALDVNDAEIVEITTCSGSYIEKFDYLADNAFDIYGRKICEKVYGENSLCHGRIEFWAKEITCCNGPGASPGRSGYCCCCGSTCGNDGRESNHITITINNGNVCSDECDYMGQTRCYDANFAQTCGNYDSDSCLEWSSPQNCGANHVCENGTCVEECTSHYTKKCYANDLYWYNSCNDREEKYQECGSDNWTDNYQCSGDWTQREKIKQGCSDNSCTNYSIWENYENCSSAGKTCSAGTCVETGQDECNYAGQNECSGTSGKTCGNYDSDSWLEWSSWNDCDTQCYHCGDGTCDSQCGETSYNCSNDCGSLPVPTVNIKANNSDGTITIAYNTSANLTWTSSNANSCYASNNWYGSKSLSGSESTGSLTYTKVYTITCSNNTAFATDSVTVHVTSAPTPTNHAPTVNAGVNKEIYGTESVVLQGYAHDPDGDHITYSWSCNGGSLSNPNIAQPTFYAPYTPNNNATYTCTLRAYDNKGLSGADSMNVLVKKHQSTTLYVSVSANPNYGDAPLNNVDLTASISGTSTGTAKFFFDCQNDGNWEKIVSSNSNSYTAHNLCNYALGGHYTARVKVERDNLSVESITVINVSATEPTQSGTLTIEKTVRNVSDNTGFASSISADPGETISFTITVKAIDGAIDNIIVKDTLPVNIAYMGNLKVSGIDSTGNIFTGLDIGKISKGKKRTITFDAKVAKADKFNYGETTLINAVLAYNTDISALDTAKVIVNKKAVLGAATSITTGAMNPIQFALLASGLMSLLITISLFILHKFLYPRSYVWQKIVSKYQNFKYYIPILP